MGLSYICATAERCYAVGAVLGSMVQMLVRPLFVIASLLKRGG